jgi:hypothetical protein
MLSKDDIDALGPEADEGAEIWRELHRVSQAIIGAADDPTWCAAFAMSLHGVRFAFNVALDINKTLNDRGRILD